MELVLELIITFFIEVLLYLLCYPGAAFLYLLTLGKKPFKKILKDWHYLSYITGLGMIILLFTRFGR